MNKQANTKTSFVKKRDIIIILALLLLAGIVYFAGSYNAQQGHFARLTIITASGNVTKDIPLGKDKIYVFEDGSLAITLEVKAGRIRFINSLCPDHNCEGFGWLQNEVDWAACVPAGASLRVAE